VWLPDWLKKRGLRRPIPEERVRILALSLFLEDRFLLERLGKRYNWELRFAISPRDGFSLASQSHFDLILCDRHQPGYPWREVMDRVASSSPRSCILLVTPVSDDHLWREVLQQGGYDVLMRPLSEEGALHAVQSAMRFASPGSYISVGLDH